MHEKGEIHRNKIFNEIEWIKIQIKPNQQTHRSIPVEIIFLFFYFVFDLVVVAVAHFRDVLMRYKNGSLDIAIKISVFLKKWKNNGQKWSTILLN